MTSSSGGLDSKTQNLKATFVYKVSYVFSLKAKTRGIKNKPQNIFKNLKSKAAIVRVGGHI